MRNTLHTQVAALLTLGAQTKEAGNQNSVIAAGPLPTHDPAASAGFSSPAEQLAALVSETWTAARLWASLQAMGHSSTAVTFRFQT